MMLDVAARTMRCDKCVEKRNEVVLELERRSLLEKRMAMEKVKFNAQQESLLEFPLVFVWMILRMPGSFPEGSLLSLVFHWLYGM